MGSRHEVERLPTATLPADLQHHVASINGIGMHYAEAGKGEPVIFLHGFPECWYSWRHQLAALADNYHVVAPDLRGYNETENRGPFDTDTLQQDVLGLIAHLGESSAHIVAHDWGGAIAWLLAIQHPAAVRTLTICNLPHPAIFQKAIRRNPRQMLRSWYILAFQIPLLPEKALAFRGYQWLAKGLINDCRPGTFTREDIKYFLETWRRQGLGGGINWYRGLLRHPRQLPKPLPKVTVPTLLIWGEQDQFLGKELTRGTDAYVNDLRVEYLPAASHWVQQEEPATVNRLVEAHLERWAGRG